MKEKLMGIIPLIVALMFVVGIGTFNGPSYAATATQTVTVTVPEAISIQVPDVNFGSVAAGSTGTSPSFTINNTGNVKIDLYVRADASAFTSPTATDTIGIENFSIFSNVTGSYLTFLTSSQKIYDNMNKAQQGTGNPATWSTTLRLTVPSFTEDGVYTITNTYTAVKHNGAAPSP
ncbi:hypothetical protein FZP57_02420 [Methanothermobacter sp. THM-1]|uniref:hypothetical protein n=1 Tax=Methanothermobacter sp. THM-1 TaxID=2606911 RepID=UPI0013677F10|nr:hypothetical protein [Methanothermobacter sp. THM-1]QHN06031.1 hypothetical protein FZP57_02420 [Methanothermobacter sp. THM-1]